MGFFSCRRAARRRPRRCGSPRGLRGSLGFSPGNDVANLDQDAGGENAAELHKAMVEQALHGYDVQPSAAHFAATKRLTP